MSSIVASLVLAASVFTPQPTQVLVNPDTQAPTLELGVLSAPLSGELSSAVKSWALSQREHWQLPASTTLKFSEAFSTRFGASFHLQQMVGDVEVYQGKLVVTLDEKRQVVQVASSLFTGTRVVDGERMTNDQATALAGAAVPLVALRPDGVPYGGSKRFYFPVGDELHEAWLANIHSLDFSKNWYVAVDATTGERLFMQNRVHHAAGDANVYPVSPGGLDAGVGATPTVIRSLTHDDGGSMIGDVCTTPLDDGGTLTYPNDAGELCGDQLTMFNCCPTEGCSTSPDAGPRRISGTVGFMGINVQYSVAVCDRMRRANNTQNGRTDYTYTPVDPPTNRMTVVGSDLANSDEFAEVHSFYHVNTVYDWMRKLSTTSAPIFGNNPTIQPFKMRDERRMPAVKVAVWSNLMFPNFNELFAGGASCIVSPPCRANTLARVDNAAFFPREQFQQLPLPGFDTGADTLLIFQGNAADAAYDATVIQHEFGHGAVYATANISFDNAAIDARSANNESGALHEGFADYIAGAFNELAEVGPYFGPRVTAGQPMTPGVRSDQYLRALDNQLNCPEVLWGEVHEDSQHVSGALWQGRVLFGGASAANRERYDAAFYAMLVSITPNADFAMVATTMAARVATAFSGNAMAAQQMTTIFMNRGVTGCSKVLDVNATNFPRPYYGIPSVSGFGQSPIPGPLQFKVAAPQGALRVRVTAVSGGGGGLFGGQPPTVRILAKTGAPITFARQGGTLQNDSQAGSNMAGMGNLTGAVDVNAACGSDVYVTLSAAGGGATLQNVQITVDPLVNCMIPVDGGTGGGGGGTTDAGTGGGGGSTGTTTLISVGPMNTTEQPNAKVGCGCTSIDGFNVMMSALALSALGLRRRKK